MENMAWVMKEMSLFPIEMPQRMARSPLCPSLLSPRHFQCPHPAGTHGGNEVPLGSLTPCRALLLWSEAGGNLGSQKMERKLLAELPI